MIGDRFDSIIFACFNEDMPYGDITTESVIEDGTFAEGYFVAKDSGITLEESELELLAERYALERGGRSARAAKQFVSGLLAGVDN